MNLFALFMLFVVAVAAVMGLILIGNHHSTTIADTYGNVAGNTTNESQAIVGNLTATGTRVGGGAILLVVGIIAAVIILALVYVARKRG